MPARPSRWRDAGGRLTRRVLLSALLVPLVVGWVSFEGERHGLFGVQLALALVALVGAATVAVLVLATARALFDADQARSHATGELRAASDRELLDASRLAALVASSDDAIIGKTLDGIITMWNAGAERMYGFSEEEVLGRSISLLVPEGRPDELASILRQIARGERVQSYETKRVRKDGSVLDVSITVSPIHDAAGAVVGATAVARDVTERYRAEAERRSLERRLARAQRLESVGQLAGGIAHDFNNLLFAIMNYAELAGKQLVELTPTGKPNPAVLGVIGEDLAQIVGVADRAARLTRQLLIFSRQDVVEVEVIDLNSVVIDVEELLQRTLGEHIELHAVLEADLPHVRANRGQLEQVLLNLAVNARDAMPDGGELRVETTLFEVDEEYGRTRMLAPGPYVCLSVSDTGTGMPPEVVAQAFDPFFTTKPIGQGTGLGLATAYGIVTQAGGDIAIYSEPDLGTTMRVHLPATEEAAFAERRESRPHDASLKGSGETILLAEDEAMVREPATRILERAGYRVLAASDANEALKLALQCPVGIALLLTDMVMPGRSGHELAAEVQMLMPGVKTLYMSGYSQRISLERGTLRPSERLLQKPFIADTLLGTVRALLDGE